jgi:branched-chain amino acid transport system permease protein
VRAERARAALSLGGPALVAALVILAPIVGVVGAELQRELMLAAIYGLIVAGFNLGFGYGGQLALGQVAVFAGGAYISGILYQHGHADLLVGAVASVAFAMFLGLITGLPGLRLNHWALALVAFFLVLLIAPLVSIFESETGGPIGIAGILGPKLAGHQLSDNAFYAVCISTTFLCLLLYRNLVVSRYGHSLVVLQQGTELAGSLGLSPYRLRMSAYLLAALPAGLAGTFYAYQSTYIQANIFDFGLVTTILTASIVAGTRSIWGAPVAAAILVVGPERLGAFDKYSVLAYGLVLIVAGLGLSSGLGGLARGIGRRLGHSSAAGAAVPAAFSDAAPESLATLSIAGESLHVSGASKRFGGVRALRDAGLDARPGAITAIIGANGAGKTTLLNAVSGIVPVDSGDVLLGDRSISRLPAGKIARAGVSRTFQTPQIPESLTVLDVAASGRLRQNWVPAAAIAFRTPRYRRVRRDDVAAAGAALRFVGLDGYERLPAQALPLGQRRILEVARCLAAEPSVILLDEPAAGLDGDALDRLRAVLLRMRDAGATVVLIEHNVTFVMDIADHVVVMDVGEVIAAGSPEVVRRDERVIASYLGRRHETHVTADQQASHEPTEVGDAV